MFERNCWSNQEKDESLHWKWGKHSENRKQI